MLGKANRKLIPVVLEPWGTFSATYLVLAADEKYRKAINTKYKPIVTKLGRAEPKPNITAKIIVEPPREITIVNVVEILSLTIPPIMAVKPPITRIIVVIIPAFTVVNA